MERVGCGEVRGDDNSKDLGNSVVTLGELAS